MDETRASLAEALKVGDWKSLGALYARLDWTTRLLGSLLGPENTCRANLIVSVRL